MSAATNERVAQLVADNTAAAAERFAIKGGNGGDLHGRSGVEPVIEAALAACGECATIRDAVELSANAAAGRTNANAARVADAIILTARTFGATRRPAQVNPITGEARYSGMHQFTASKWTPTDSQP